MRATLNSLKRRLVGFHEDECGMEAIQVVALVAIAAIILVFLKTVIWPKIRGWVIKETDPLVN